MEKIMTDYAAFARAMNEERLYESLDFVGICIRIGADPVAMDALIQQELGYTGESLVDSYRTSSLASIGTKSC